MKTCYIVGAGELYGSFVKKDGDLVIAADGGYNALMKMNITPDLLIGDMDSIKADAKTVERLVFPTRKDETDSFLAYREGVKRGYTDFALYGCVGGREDHTFANYSLLIYAKKQGHTVRLVGNGYETFALFSETKEICGVVGDYISFFAFGGECKGVTLKGFEYPLDGYTLSPDFPLGVSNKFASECATVTVKDGALLVMKETKNQHLN